MRLSTGQHAVRLTCGLGLLILPAVQQKLCTWPILPESESREPAGPAPAPTSSEQPEPKSKRPLTLAAMLPDVAPPRWPNHTYLTAAQRGRPLPVTTWMNGSSGGEDEPVDSTDSDSLAAESWPRIPAPQRLPTFGNAGVRLVRVHRHLFQTSILRTGPPRT